MIITFNIINQTIDLTNTLSDNKRKEWWFKNCWPSIPLDTKIEDLTEEHKKSLIKLAIYEGYLDSENLCNQPNKSFEIK